MATLTKTFTETDTTLPRKSWTIALTGTNQTVSGNFTLTAPTMTAKTSLYASKTGYTPQNTGGALVDMYFNVGGSIRFNRGGYEDATYVTGTTYTLSREMVDLSITLSNVFNSSNRTSKTASVIAYSDTWGIGVGSVSYNASQAMYWYNDYTNQSKYTWGTIATLTLNAPPSVANATPSYPLPYAGLGEYSVSVTSASAQYSGYLLSLTLTIGTQTKTLNFTNQTSVTNQTLSLTPNVAGTFTPTITATDSRGQTKTVSLPQITVNPYLVPSVNFNVFRVNDNAIRDDEGHLCLIDANISYTDAVATLTEPSVKIDGIDIAQQAGASIAWYTNWDNTSGVSGAISDWSALTPTNSKVHVYGLIDWDYDVTGKFADDKSYQITLIGNDSLNGHSVAISQTMSTAYYTIDFQAGGKEVAFGAPANDDLTNIDGMDCSDIGLFKCAMNALMKGNTNSGIIGEIKMYGGSTTPSGWVFCDGSALSRVTYSKLFAVIGTTYGTGDGSTTFNVPDMRARAVIGTNNADLPNGQNSSFTARNRNATGGVETVKLTAAQSGLREHNHTQNSHDHGQDSHNHTFAANFYVRHGKDSGTIWVAAGTNTTITEKAYSSTWAGGGSLTSYSHKPDRVNISGNTGGKVANTQAATATNIKATAQDATTAHNNMPPFIAVNYMIFTGVF